MGVQAQVKTTGIKKREKNLRVRVRVRKRLWLGSGIGIETKLNFYILIYDKM